VVAGRLQVYEGREEEEEEEKEKEGHVQLVNRDRRWSSLAGANVHGLSAVGGIAASRIDRLVGMLIAAAGFQPRCTC
jgi:hypothetical protein